MNFLLLSTLLNIINSEDDYELPNQPVWHKEQLVKFDDIRDRQERNGQSSNTSDDDQVCANHPRGRYLMCDKPISAWLDIYFSPTGQIRSLW